MVSLKAVICCMLITLTCPPLAADPAARQTMRKVPRGIEMNGNESGAGTTVTDGEGSDLPSLVT